MIQHREFFDFFGATLALLGLGVAYFAIWLGVRQERIKRELEHRERMRALELGRALPGDRSWLSPIRIGLLLALVVPVCVMGLACLATRTAGYQSEMWKFCTIVSLVAVFCGTVITCVAASSPGYAARVSGGLPEKAGVDEDLYDVVSARG